jgi:hypothetical protein
MTTNNYRYRLDNKRPTRLFRCPQCNRRQFKRYIDVKTDDFLDENVGRCNRENSCGYHYTPKQFFTENHQKRSWKLEVPLYTALPTSNFKSEHFDTIPKEIVAATLRHYERNNFVVYLRSLFGESLAANLCQRFGIGTSKQWEGATIFWQRDLSGNYRTGEMKCYNAQTGKRNKENNNWVHSLYKKKENIGFQLLQCLFGLHQLLHESLDKPIAVVESPKTAVILSAIYPKYIWLATSGAKSLNEQKMLVLQGRTIILFPDTDKEPYQFWQTKCAELQSDGLNIRLSTLLYDRLTAE